MIKRNKRNLNKIVRINNPNSVLHGRKGKVLGFRGDYNKDIPYVLIFVPSLNGKGGMGKCPRRC